MKRSLVSLALILSVALAHPLAAQQQSAETPVKPSKAAEATSDASDRQAEQEANLAAYLTGAKFVGKFTIDGKEDVAPKTEEYTISKCQKLPEKNMYRFTARIKYGDVDQEVPMDLKVLWSGNTPVITLDSFWIPGMGTFGARVLIHKNRYAGTWQHDAVGGHMFGKIEKAKAKSE